MDIKNKSLTVFCKALFNLILISIYFAPHSFKESLFILT